MVPMPSFKVQCALNLEMVMLTTAPELEGALLGKAGGLGGSVGPAHQAVDLLHQAARWVGGWVGGVFQGGKKGLHRLACNTKQSNNHLSRRVV